MVEVKTRLTEIRQRNQIDHSPNEVCLFTLHLKPQLASGPTMGAVAPDHILRLDLLSWRIGILFWGMPHLHRDRVRGVVFGF